MERIMNEKNEWDQNVEADLVEGPVERVGREEIYFPLLYILASHSSYSLSPLDVAMRSSQLLIGSFYLF